MINLRRDILELFREAQAPLVARYERALWNLARRRRDRINEASRRQFAEGQWRRKLCRQPVERCPMPFVCECGAALRTENNLRLHRIKAHRAQAAE